MSDFVQGALVAGGLTLAGVLLTQLTNLLLEKRREEASYRVNLYDKRLAVHQQAYEWLQRLHLAVGDAAPVHTTEKAKQLADLSERAGRWWDASCLYLDPESREQFLRFAYEVGMYSRGQGPPVLDHWVKAVMAIERGIGMKHISTRESGA
jgi:hypothetical protein